MMCGVCGSNKNGIAGGAGCDYIDIILVDYFDYFFNNYDYKIIFLHGK
jgi:hypothetical protein